MFVVIHGTKLSYRPIGWVAEFCPLCRKAQPHRIEEMRMVRHVYWVPMGQGTLRGHAIACPQCGRKRGVNLRAYRQVVADPNLPIETLAAHTRPRLGEEIHQIAERERRVRSGQAQGTERMQVIVDTLTAYRLTLDIRAANVHLDWQTVLALFTTIATFLVGTFVVCNLPAQQRTAGPLIAMLLLTAIPGVITYLLGRTEVIRFARRKAFPFWIEQLAPLRPTAEELQAAFAQLAASGSALGRKIKPGALFAAIQNAEPHAARQPVRPAKVVQQR